MAHDIKAVVFDVDGTLLDTREFLIQAFEHALKQNGYAPATREAIVAAATGRPLHECYLILTPNGDIEALSRSHREFQTERHDLISAYEGLNEILAKLRARNIWLGICSTRATTVRSSLQHMQILEHFDAVIDGLDVKEHKPHPEGVLKVLEILNIPPQQAVMIGDTASDIEAGKAAGCAFTIGIIHGLGTRESLETAGADHIVERLSEILPIILRT